MCGHPPDESGKALVRWGTAGIPAGDMIFNKGCRMQVKTLANNASPVALLTIDPRSMSPKHAPNAIDPTSVSHPKNAAAPMDLRNFMTPLNSCELCPLALLALPPIASGKETNHLHDRAA